MALATRCPHCGTAFRLVPDQIKLRNGLVRCGVCGQVFDSGPSLVEIPPPAAGGEPTPPLRPPPADSSIDAAQDFPAVLRKRDSARPGQAHLEDDVPPAVPDALATDGIAPALAGEDPFHVIPPHATSFDEDVQSEPAGDGATADGFAVTPPAGFETPDARDEPWRLESFSARGEPLATAVTAPPVAALPGEAGIAPFMDEEAQARRHRRAWRWGIAALLALLALLAQGIWTFRTELATSLPALRPALESACRVLRCTVAYPRDPALLSIESSALEPWGEAAPPAGQGPANANADQSPAPSPPQPVSGNSTAPANPAGAASDATTAIDASETVETPDTPRHLALTVVLRNRAAFAQPWPAFDLALTDLHETVVARKVVLPSAYLPPAQLSTPLAPGEERVLRIPVDTTGVQANGYRLDLFFP